VRRDVSLKIDLAPDERIVLEEKFKILDGLQSIRFVLSNQAVHLPVLRFLPATTWEQAKGP
jgi:hypothetical protein